MKEYYPVIGIEIHIELNTKTKLFSRSLNHVSDQPNSNISAYDLGFPGTLPFLNKNAVKKAYLIGAFFNCKLAKLLQFDRKHYFYYDLPKGYQITQFYHPFATKGEILVKDHLVKITEIHLEEDTAQQYTDVVTKQTRLNFNRAGVPLVEIVTEPCFTNASQICDFISVLKSALINLDVSHAKLEAGELRCDINISLQTDRLKLVSNKVEIKNLNSYRAIKNAIKFEIDHQTALLNDGVLIKLETRRYDEQSLSTVLMRTKADYIDYDFFPEPNIIPVKVVAEIFSFGKKRVVAYKNLLNKLKNKHQLKFNELNALTNTPDLLAIYLKIQKQLDDNFNFVGWWFNTISPYLTKHEVNQAFINNIVTVLKAVATRKVLPLIVKQKFDLLASNQLNVDDFLKKYEMKQTEINLNALLDQILKEHPQIKTDYQNRPDRVLKFMIGQLMKLTKGRLDPVAAMLEIKTYFAQK